MTRCRIRHVQVGSSLTTTGQRGRAGRLRARDGAEYQSRSRSPLHKRARQCTVPYCTVHSMSAPKAYNTAPLQGEGEGEVVQATRHAVRHRETRFWPVASVHTVILEDPLPCEGWLSHLLHHYHLAIPRIAGDAALLPGLPLAHASRQPVLVVAAIAAFFLVLLTAWIQLAVHRVPLSLSLASVVSRCSTVTVVVLGCILSLRQSNQRRSPLPPLCQLDNQAQPQI